MIFPGNATDLTEHHSIGPSCYISYKILLKHLAVHHMALASWSVIICEPETLRMPRGPRVSSSLDIYSVFISMQPQVLR